MPQSIIFSHSIEEMTGMLLEYAKDLCHKKGAAAEAPFSRIIDQAIEYVNENYADYSLNVNAIADHFEKHPVYFSSLFKESTGMRLLDFLSRTRLSHAKELMLATGLSLKEIAGRTGFSDNNALIRAFKKFEGITPSEYRRLARCPQK